MTHRRRADERPAGDPVRNTGPMERDDPVADARLPAPRAFDVATVEHLIALMAQHELSEITLVEGEQRIRLKKGYAAPVTATPLAPVTYAPAAVAAPSGPVAEAPKPKSSLIDIKSPMVGTFYSKPSPDKPDYVSVGSKVTATTVVCKLEAMKIFNDLTADVAGTIAEVCIKNAQPVDFGTVLFRVEPA